MSSLKFSERMVLEKAFGMGSGYVLNFSDRTFQEFIWEHVGRDVYGGDCRIVFIFDGGPCRQLDIRQVDILADIQSCYIDDDFFRDVADFTDEIDLARSDFKQAAVLQTNRFAFDANRDRNAHGLIFGNDPEIDVGETARDGVALSR